MTATIPAPFPYIGGKSSVAPLVWSRFGDTPNFIEPFFGSGAVLFGRPHDPGIETVNDTDGLLSNFWRAIQADPECVAHFADWPVCEVDLHARHSWLVNHRESLTAQLEGDPDFFDAKAAGYWVYGACAWIGGGWCAGVGPWHSVDGRLVKLEREPGGVKRQIPHLGDAGQGINRQIPHLGDAGQGINRQIPHLGDAGQGISRRRPHLRRHGMGIHAAKHESDLYAYFEAIALRLRRVRICTGDWTRVCGPTPTIHNGTTAIFLDPPYSHALRDTGCYAVETDCSTAVRMWAIEHGDDPRYRICLAGYANEHEMPDTWECVAWKAQGGFGNQGAGRGRDNAALERLWFSPHCIKSDAVLDQLRMEMGV